MATFKFSASKYCLHQKFSLLPNIAFTHQTYIASTCEDCQTSISSCGQSYSSCDGVAFSPPCQVSFQCFLGIFLQQQQIVTQQGKVIFVIPFSVLKAALPVLSLIGIAQKLVSPHTLNIKSKANFYILATLRHPTLKKFPTSKMFPVIPALQNLDLACNC